MPIQHLLRISHLVPSTYVPIMTGRSEPSTRGEAIRLIDEIAEVMQLTISPSGSDLISDVGAHAWYLGRELEKHHRTSGVMWQISDSPNII